jgi:hypothetical protein
VRKARASPLLLTFTIAGSPVARPLIAFDENRRAAFFSTHVTRKASGSFPGFSPVSPLSEMARSKACAAWKAARIDSTGNDLHWIGAETGFARFQLEKRV